MMLELQEDETFYFDEAAADRVVRFIEKFCIHYEGKFAGEPFLLHPKQKRIVRDLFGWKWRDSGLRRFTDVYFEAAVGSGKSPLLAAIGLYGLIADGEQGAQVYSLASHYSQARIVFDTAKKFAQSSPALAPRLQLRQYEIRHPGSNSFWRIVSGKGPGAGCRPTMIVGDEIHDWKSPGAYQALHDRMYKRRQPMFIGATNAGESQASFCWSLREKAIAALAGTGDPSLYPIIWKAEDDAETLDSEAWRKANPLIGTTISEAKVAQLATEAVKIPEEEANFRRLYMGVWPKTAGGRWLDLNLWDACTANFNASDRTGEAMYAGLDLSQGDDLCAAVFIWVAEDVFHIGSHFWVPRATAEFYEQRDGTPYSKWADAGHITLLEQPTIDTAARKAIASHVLTTAKSHKVKAVCYDRYKADECVAGLEAGKLVCVPIAQGYSISPGCFELERRLKEASVVIADNPVLRFCAENTEVKGDDRGNIWPVKPNAKGEYAGKRSAKIDGISALVTALTEARKHAFPAAKKQWAGVVEVI